MALTFGKLTLLSLAFPLSLFTSVAGAQESPCGKFDFTKGVDCKIAVSGGCKAQCTPIQFEAGCTGGCTTEVKQTCTNDCETQCLTQCDPGHLDCVAGCHGECDQPCTDKCNAEHPGEDCVTSCKSSCGMHCKSACGVTPSDCMAHCKECCHGSCDTQVNLDCDLQCYAKLKGGCEAHCEAPTGALFCNGQYIFASDVNQCIAFLAQQGITVNVDARVEGEVKCDLSGCKGTGGIKTNTGCSAAPGESAPLTASGIAAGVVALGLITARRRGRGAGRK